MSWLVVGVELSCISGEVGNGCPLQLMFGQQLSIPGCGGHASMEVYRLLIMGDLMCLLVFT